MTADIPHGSVIITPSRGLSAYERFMRLVSTPPRSGGCHPWAGAVDGCGYGMFWSDGRSQRSHRWLLGYLRGHPLRSGEFALHRCDNPPCCNPDHLYVGSRLQNHRDAIERHRGSAPELMSAKTMCPRGHHYSAANTYRDASNRRHCRTCSREASHRYCSRADVVTG